GLTDILEALDLDSLVYTGEHEDFFFWVESELRQRLGPDVAGRLHTGRSRNDIDHTVFKLALKERLAQFRDQLASLVEALIRVAEREAATIVIAYTHGQPAQPTTFGHYLGAIIEVLLRDLDRLEEVHRTVDLSSMGAAAITTTGFPLDRERVASLLGFGGVQENSYGCIAACDYTSATYSAVKLVFLHLGRFIQDLNQWTGFETGHLYVPNAFVQISSIMPQKRNPVPIEHLRLMSSLAIGRCDTILTTLHNTPFTDMNDNEGEVHAAGYEAFDTGARVFSLLAALIEAVQVDQAKVRAHIESSCITVTELADTMVREEGLPFRIAHEIAGGLARAMIAAGEGPSTVPFERFQLLFEQHAKRPPRLDQASFRAALSPERFVSVRTVLGGPALAPLAKALAGYRTRLSVERDHQVQHQVDIEEAAERLAAQVSLWRSGGLG
ncbi:MAG: argininosuccinate lyase, partial [Alphaproteobacteria bacterium]|nr:argininosuccinate lyase [Alphaproteobacteria bacterium]